MKIKKIYKNILSFYDVEIMHCSASLSFYTILSLIPVILLSLSIFTQLPSFDKYYKILKDFIFSNLLPSHQNIITNYLETFLANSVSLGIIGFCAIIFTSIMFFSEYEFVVNHIMKTKTRGFFRSLSTYWTLITLAPIGLAASFYLSSLFQAMLNQNEFTSKISLSEFLPYLIIWAIFALMYVISITRDIRLKIIIFSSFIASLVWNLSKIIFVEYTIYNKTYASIYGSFSVLLFFFLWIYVSWGIFLYGLRLCFLLDKSYDKNTQSDTDRST